MSWIERLCETYDICNLMSGDNKPLPIAHSTANAQIEVCLNGKGDIVKEFTHVIEKDGKNEITIIPVTEDSETRTSGIFPHPLHDKLCYVAGDYSEYTGNK